MKPDTHTQCKLQRDNTVTVGWIPTKHAIKGNTVHLKTDDKGSEGWVVVETWTTRPTEELKERERDFTRQRDASDV